MSIQIFYNNILACPSGQPTPLPSFTENSIRYNNRWAVLQNVTLHGQLSGCTYNSLLTAKNNLEQIFSSDFQPLSIIQDNKIVYFSNYNRITDIAFAESSYFGLLNYTVSLESYPIALFSGVYGVIEPVNEWNFVEQDNKILEVTHRVSAK